MFNISSIKASLNCGHMMYWLGKHQALLMFSFLCLAVLFSPDSFALKPEDQLDELKEVVSTGQQMTKTIAYLIGLAAGCFGTYKFVQTQSMGTAGTSAAISICAFKFPAWMSAAALI